MFPKTEAFLIRCTTGCSCCRAENELHGPWRTLAAAEEQAKRFEAIPLLASQYALRGRYEIIQVEAELLPDGRLILGGLWIAPGFIEDSKFGSPVDPLLMGESIDLLRGTSTSTQVRAA